MTAPAPLTLDDPLHAHFVFSFAHDEDPFMAIFTIQPVDMGFVPKHDIVDEVALGLDQDIQIEQWFFFFVPIQRTRRLITFFFTIKAQSISPNLSFGRPGMDNA